MSSLGRRLLETWLSISLPPLFILGVVSLIVATSEIDDALKERVATAAKGVSMALRADEEKILIRTNAFAATPTLSEALAASDRLQVLALAEQARELLDVDRVTVLDHHGRVVARGHDPAKYGDTLPRAATSLDLRVPKAASTLGDGDGGMGTQAAAPVVDDQGKLLGTVLAQHPLDYRSLLDLKRQFGVEFTLWNGDRLQTTTLRDQASIRQALQARNALNNGAAQYAASDLYFARSTPTAGKKQAEGLLVAIGTQGSRALQVRLTLLIVLVVLASIALALVVGYFATRRIVQPIQRLAAAAEEAARGNLEVPISIDTEDEIAELGASFRSMLERRREVEHELRETQAELQERVEKRTLELRRSEEHLAQARRLEALGRLAGGIAHDFNNLLTAIGGNVELAKADLERFDAPPEFVEELNEIQLGAKHAAELVRQLMAFSRNQIREAVVIDLGDIVRGLEKLLGRLHTEDVRLHLRIDRGPFTLRADPTQMGQILVNLVVNAQDALPQGGNIWVRVQRHQQAELDQLSQVPPGTFTCLEVRDDGVGMDRETAQRIFEPFFTTKAPGKGTGMGLATVHGIVQQSGGFTQVDTQPGRGTSFRVLFPLVEAEATAKVPEPEAIVQGAGQTILLCEDDFSVRRVTASYLQGAGYRVLLAASGTEALAIAERESDIALLLTDVIMPAANGVEIARNLRSRLPQLKVLYMSGYTSDVLDSRAGVESAVNLISKPFTRPQLLTQVRLTLQAPRRQNGEQAG